MCHGIMHCVMPAYLMGRDIDRMAFCGEMSRSSFNVFRYLHLLTFGGGNGISCRNNYIEKALFEWEDIDFIDE